MINKTSTILSQSIESKYTMHSITSALRRGKKEDTNFHPMCVTLYEILLQEEEDVQVAFAEPE